MEYGVALMILDRREFCVEVGGHMVENDGEDQEVVVGGPGPRSPMGKIPIEEEQYSQDALDDEPVADYFPFGG